MSADKKIGEIKKKAKPGKTVMVFGVFDNFHMGHTAFLRQAREHGERLIAVVAPPTAVHRLKNKPPVQTLRERIKGVASSATARHVVRGDTIMGAWNVIRKIRPDIIALGYDQKELRRELIKFKKESHMKFAVRTMKPYRSAQLHSSILKK